MAFTAQPRQATLYRMVMDNYVCPYGLKAKDLLRRQGFTVVDSCLTSREATDAFKAEHGVQTTPLVFIGGLRIGGYDDLRRYFGKTGADPKVTTYVQRIRSLDPDIVALGVVFVLLLILAPYLTHAVV